MKKLRGGAAAIFRANSGIEGGGEGSNIDGAATLMRQQH
jgi:hypothetical protein